MSEAGVNKITMMYSAASPTKVLCSNRHSLYCICAAIPSEADITPPAKHPSVVGAARHRRPSVEEPATISYPTPHQWSARRTCTPGHQDAYPGVHLRDGVVALSVEYRTFDREVVGSSLGRARGVETLGKFLTPMCLCSPSSISWYRPKGGDALRLGSKGRYGLCVGGR